MRNNSEDTARPGRITTRDLPTPTASFKLRAWREFQRALDPLAPPRALRLPRV